MTLKKFLSNALAVTTLLTSGSAAAQATISIEEFNARVQLLTEMNSKGGDNFNYSDITMAINNAIFGLNKDDLKDPLVNSLYEAGRIKMDSKIYLNEEIHQLYFIAETCVNNNNFDILKQLLIENDFDLQVIDAYIQLFTNFRDFNDPAFADLLNFHICNGKFNGINMGSASEDVDIALDFATIKMVSQFQAEGKISIEDAVSTIEALFERIDGKKANFMYRILKNTCNGALIKECEKVLKEEYTTEIKDEEIIVAPQPSLINLDNGQTISQGPTPENSDEKIIAASEPVFIGLEGGQTIPQEPGLTYEDYRNKIVEGTGIANAINGSGINFNLENGELEAVCYLFMLGDLSESAKLTIGEMGISNTTDVLTKFYNFLERLYQLYEGDTAMVFPYNYFASNDSDLNLSVELETIMNYARGGYGESGNMLTTFVNKITDPNQMIGITSGAKTAVAQLTKYAIRTAKNKGLISEEQANQLTAQIDNSGLSNAFAEENDRYTSERMYILFRAGINTIYV